MRIHVRSIVAATLAGLLGATMPAVGWADARNGTAGRPGTVLAAPSSTTPSVANQAAELSRAAGRNSITVHRSGGVATRYDLQGRPHFDKRSATTIRTPHVHHQTPRINIAPSGIFNNPTTTTRPMTQSDIRTVRRVLEQRGTIPPRNVRRGR
ncbi:MAG: hypothetical protein AB7P02_28685 [Alphaproteobacteria bacterium]